MPEESTARTPRPTLLRTAVVVGVAVAAALGGGMAIAANAPAPGQAAPPTTTTTAAAADDFVGIQPVRVLDTRNAAGGPIGISPGHKLAAGETIDVAVGGVGGVPANASSVAINITIDDDATLKSFLTVWPTGQPKPNTSANNAEPGLVSPNSAIFQLGTGGKLSVFNQQGAVNVIIDVTGYFIGSEEVPTTTTTVPGETTTTTVPAGPAATATAFRVGSTVVLSLKGTGWTNCGTDASFSFDAPITTAGVAAIEADGTFVTPFFQLVPTPTTGDTVTAHVTSIQTPTCTTDVTLTAP